MITKETVLDIIDTVRNRGDACQYTAGLIEELVKEIDEVGTTDDVLARITKRIGDTTLSTTEHFEESEEYVARYWPALSEVCTYQSPMNGF